MRFVLIVLAITALAAWSAYVYFKPDGFMIIAVDPLNSVSQVRVITHVKRNGANGAITHIANPKSRWQVRSVEDAVSDILDNKNYVTWCADAGWPALVTTSGGWLSTVGDPATCNNLENLPSDIDWDDLQPDPCEEGAFADKAVCRFKLYFDPNPSNKSRDGS